MNSLQAIQPTVAVKLEADEQAYAEFYAYRAGKVTSFKTKGAGIGTSIAGVGVGVGGSESVAGKKFRIVADGKLLLTDKRMIIVGESFTQIPYEGIHTIKFKKASGLTKYKWQQMAGTKAKWNIFADHYIPVVRGTVIMSVLYEGGLDNEQYMVTSKNGRELEAIYNTIANQQR